MLITFLNTLGIPHDGNGIVNELPETLDKEKLAKAVDEQFEKYPAGVASVYLQMFHLQTEDGWEELAEVLRTIPALPSVDVILLRDINKGHSVPGMALFMEANGRSCRCYSSSRRNRRPDGTGPV